jgi:hypothetical protein
MGGQKGRIRLDEELACGNDPRSLMQPTRVTKADRSGERKDVSGIDTPSGDLPVA